MPAGPRTVREACVTGVDSTDADRKVHRTLPGDASTQYGPAGAATAVLQLGMALLQPVCADHAWREANSAIWSRAGLPRTVGKPTIDRIRRKALGKVPYRLEVAAWEKKTAAGNSTVGLVPKQSLVTMTSLKCPVGYGVRGMDG